MGRLPAEILPALLRVAGEFSAAVPGTTSRGAYDVPIATAIYHRAGTAASDFDVPGTQNEVYFPLHFNTFSLFHGVQGRSPCARQFRLRDR